MGFSHNGKNDEVSNNEYKSKSKAVGDTTEVLAAESTSNLAGRQILTLSNHGPNTVYYGPTGTAIADREKLECGQFMSVPVGDCVDVTLLTNTGEPATVIIQEWS